MKAEYVEINGQFYAKNHREVIKRSSVAVGGLVAAEPQSNEIRPLERKPQARKGRKGGVLVVVTFVPFIRHGRGGRPVDEDNYGHSQLKSMRDQIAAELGIDDGDPRIRFEYAPPVITKGRPGTHVTVTAL